MLEKLGSEEKRIFDAELSQNKLQLELREACDGFFNYNLTKKEVIELANDFLEIASQMVDWPEVLGE